MSVNEITALVANIATTVGVVAAIIFGIRAQRTETKNAQAAASRTEAAAALTADSTPQLVDALREIVNQSGRSAAPPLGVRWSLRNYENDLYMLENIGSEEAHNVRVSSHESLMLINAPAPQNLEPGHSVTFSALPSLATSDYTITVTWEADGEQKAWRYPLPPRGPKP